MGSLDGAVCGARLGRRLRRCCQSDQRLGTSISLMARADFLSSFFALYEPSTTPPAAMRKLSASTSTSMSQSFFKADPLAASAHDARAMNRLFRSTILTTRGHRVPRRDPPAIPARNPPRTLFRAGVFAKARSGMPRSSASANSVSRWDWSAIDHSKFLLFPQFFDRIFRLHCRFGQSDAASSTVVTARRRQRNFCRDQVHEPCARTARGVATVSREKVRRRATT